MEKDMTAMAVNDNGNVFTEKKTKISIELYEIVMKSFIQTYFFLCLLMAEFMRVTLGGYKGNSSTLTLKSNSVENN